MFWSLDESKYLSKSNKSHLKLRLRIYTKFMMGKLIYIYKTQWVRIEQIQDDGKFKCLLKLTLTLCRDFRCLMSVLNFEAKWFFPVNIRCVHLAEVNVSIPENLKLFHRKYANEELFCILDWIKLFWLNVFRMLNVVKNSEENWKGDKFSILTR